MTSGAGDVSSEDRANRELVEAFFAASERGDRRCRGRDDRRADGDGVAAVGRAVPWSRERPRGHGRGGRQAAVRRLTEAHRVRSAVGADGPAPLRRGRPPVRGDRRARERSDPASDRVSGARRSPRRMLGPPSSTATDRPGRRRGHGVGRTGRRRGSRSGPVPTVEARVGPAVPLGRQERQDHRADECGEEQEDDDPAGFAVHAGECRYRRDEESTFPAGRTSARRAWPWSG